MPFYTDQLNREIEILCPPKRIISLVPSQTELLYDLGLDKEVIGLTNFCIHPIEWFYSKTRVGGTKNINFKKIEQLKPDLIIGNKEENEKEQIEKLMTDYKVWMSDIYNLNDALNMIVQLGALVSRPTAASLIKLKITEEFMQLLNFKKELSVSTSVAYLIWRKPFMVAGSNTFIDDMLSHCNFTNVFAKNSRYFEISEQKIAEAMPEIILLSSEPYPFKEKHIQEIQNLCPNSKIILIDGELFSWYGSRLLKAASYFKKLIIKKTY